MIATSNSNHLSTDLLFLNLNFNDVYIKLILKIIRIPANNDHKFRLSKVIIVHRFVCILTFNIKAEQINNGISYCQKYRVERKALHICFHVGIVALLSPHSPSQTILRYTYNTSNIVLK